MKNHQVNLRSMFVAPMFLLPAWSALNFRPDVNSEWEALAALFVAPSLFMCLLCYRRRTRSTSNGLLFGGLIGASYGAIVAFFNIAITACNGQLQWNSGSALLVLLLMMFYGAFGVASHVAATAINLVFHG